MSPSPPSSPETPAPASDDSVELVSSPEEEHQGQQVQQQEQPQVREPEPEIESKAEQEQQQQQQNSDNEQEKEQEEASPAPPPPVVPIIHEPITLTDSPVQPPPQQPQPRPEPAAVQLSPVTEFYRGKTILLTGATGFVGKAVLWKLVQSLGPSLGKIYLLIRNGSNKRSKIGRPADRIKSEILSNKAFLALRTSMGEATFDSIMQEKIVPIAGDIISPDLSLSDQDRETVVKEVQVVIHCAATLDYHERLDLALETNTLGTLRLMDLADECENMLSFVHMSVSYFNANLPDGYVQERVYPMEIGDPEDLLKEIVGLELQDIPKMTQRVMASYPNTYTFTKFLTEHLILKRVDYNRVEEAQGGKKQWPVSIVRATQVGAGAFEPLPGWVDGVTGTNGAVFLLGHGIQVLQTDIGHMPADIIPVDYLARIIISSAAVAKAPGTRFLLPYNEIITEEDEIASPLPQPIVACFPIVYQVSGSSLKMATWREVYEAVRHYWVRNTKIALPTGQEYFVNNRALLKARLFMKNQFSNSLSSVTTTISGNAQNNNNVSPYGTRNMSRPTNRTIELASRIVEANQPFLRHRWVFDHQNVRMLAHDLESDPVFRLSPYKHIDWASYMVNYSYGTHLYIAQCPLGLRNIVVPPGCDCALYSKNQVIRDSIIEKQIESVVFSISDIQKRTERMLTQLIETLEKPNSYNPRDKKKNEEWINDFDASLDDWCHDDTQILRDANAEALLGRWSKVLGENDEAIKVVVLNDKRVRDSVEQIISSSGVPQGTVVGEAMKLLQRMRERTQLPYVWFAGAFLDCLFKRLFTSIRIQESDLNKLKDQIRGKNVVYVPVSRTILDQLLVWYVCLRYHLPMPAIICDEALALLGPISDIFRIAGAYFVRRDQTTRSPLSTAVTAAYTEAMLHDHGALSMLIEKTRSRTGRLHNAYSDGLIDMVLDASLEKHQPSAPSTPTSKTRNSLSQKVRKDTVFVPLNITYEKIPELHMLIDQVLDQKHHSQPSESGPQRTMSTLARSSSFLRPSASMAGRTANKDNGVNDKGKYGRVYIGISNVIDVRKMAEERCVSHLFFFRKPYANSYILNSRDEDENQHEFANTVARTIQKRHHEASAVSPVSLVAAVVLFGRTSNGITMGAIYEHVTWFRDELKSKSIPLDWQDDEDVDAMVAYSLNLLDARQNITIEGKRVTEYSNVRVVEHADNVMALSYMANALVEMLLPDALFAISYFSTGTDEVSRHELYGSFKFLIQLFKDEFIYPWDQQEKFSQLLSRFLQKGHLVETGSDTFVKRATLKNDPTTYTHICLLASLLYPTLDAYWITSCSLSALRDLPYMPRKIVPVLAQWIAAHLISGRRTIYREVLSTEASQNAVDNFLAIGFIEAVHPKTKLSPDAQILLLELGVTTNEDLVMVAPRRKSQENAECDDGDMLGRLEDIASLCHNIEKHRFGTTAQLEAYRSSNAQVFDKCQNQIRTILRSGGKSYATIHGMDLSKDEDQMIQLVYSLKTAASGVERTGGVPASRNPRRVSEAYNLLNSPKN
ncbi:male sterility protein-domain-containing protein [Zychaea mexicana]|uniref:male sterility protein-domain-containing protein n=1 Tax=Zychaea mexicana TaxID=64656 RepID=UPI0022FE6D8D|nr:male sterility protein-domain-containing protein [Zychaea mexicana]KAI9498954.1 male sterility protein-domain-containing protein [Zychaea mexicana]